MTESTGKVLLIAGASSGMGRELALLAATPGARLVLFARRAERLRDVEKKAVSQGASVLAIAGDARDESAAIHAVESALERFGRLDVLANFVGTNVRERALTALTGPGWREVLSTNLDAAFVLTQAVLPAFRQQRDGLLLHVSSSAAKKADASGVAYQASKAGLAALAHGTMEEERSNGIRVTVVFPGFTDTPFVEKRPVKPAPDELRRALQPEDVARICLAVISLPARAYLPEVQISPTQL